MGRKIYKSLSAMLAIILSVSAPVESVAAVFHAATFSTEEQNNAGEAWIVPVNTWSNFEKNNKTTDNRYNMEVNQHALITKNENDTYHVRLEYAGYSVYDMVQVVNPEYNDKLIPYIQESRASSTVGLSGLNWGTFNAKAKEEYHTPSAYEKYIEPYIDEKANEFYFKNEEFKLSQANQAMDTGFIEFDIADLSSDIVINPCYSSGASSSMYKSAFVVDLEENNMVPVPVSLSYEQGDYTMGYNWTNYIQAKANSTNTRSNDANVYTYLYSVFENNVTVNIDKNGCMSATFHVKKNGEDPVTKIEIAKSRDTDISKITNKLQLYAYSKDILGCDFETVWSDDSIEDEVTIPFEDMLDSKLIRISSQETAKTNAGATEANKIYYYGYLCLQKSVNQTGDNIYAVDEATGAVLNGTSESLPDFQKFEVKTPKLEEAFGDSASQVYGFIENNDKYIVYQYRIYNTKGELIRPNGAITIDLPIPDSYNEETICYTYDDENGVGMYGLPDMGSLIESEGKKYMRITPKSSQNFYYTICVYDQGSPMTSDDLAGLEEGYYKVQPTLGYLSSGITDRPSMSSGSVKDKQAILEVVKKGEEYNLYMTLDGVRTVNWGYIYKWYSYYGDENNLKQEAEVYKYKSSLDLRDVEWEAFKPDKTPGNLMIDEFTTDYQLYYPQTIKIALSNQKSNGAFKMGIVVPVMNAFGDAGIKKGVKNLDLRLIKGYCEPVSAETLPSYDKSLLKGVMYDVQWFIDELGEADTDPALISALKAAEAAYDTMADEPEEELLFTEINKLKAALAAAGGGEEDTQLVTDGTYEVPFGMYDSGTDTVSARRDYFQSPAKLKVSQDEMTVTLNVQENSGDYVTRLQYDNDQKLKDAEISYNDDGTIKAFTFTRPYTEDTFEIALYTQRYSYETAIDLKLDLNNAYKITASDEQVAELNTLLKELKALESGNYTSSSMEALKSVIEAVEIVMSQSDYLEYDTYKAQMEHMNTAKAGLVSLVELKAKITAAQAITPSSEELLQAITSAQNVAERADASKSDVASAIAALNFLMGTSGAVTDLADGNYNVPFEIYENGTSSALKSLFDMVELKLDGDHTVMTVTMDSNTYSNVRFSVENGDASDAVIQGMYDSGVERFSAAWSKSGDAGKKLWLYLYQDGIASPVVVEIRLDYSSADEAPEKNDLYAKIILAEGYLNGEGVYTDATTQVLKDSITAARFVLRDQEVSLSQIDAAILNLEQAVEGLQKPADKTVLNNTITVAVGYYDNKERYTEASTQNLAVAIEAAREVYAGSAVTQDSIDIQVELLLAAIDGLEYQLRADLGKLLEEAKAYDETQYEEESWNILAATVVSADIVYQNQELEEQDYKDALEVLLKAVNDLEELPDNQEKLELLQQFLDKVIEASADETLFEETSYASMMASIEAAKDMLDSSNGYKLTTAQIEAQIEALEAEYAALIALDELTGEEEKQSYSYKKISYDAFETEDTYDAEEIEDETELETDIETEADIEIETEPEEEPEIETKEAEKATPSDASSKETEPVETTEAVKRVSRGASMGRSINSLSDVLEDGVYCVNIALWQYSENKESMGHPALTDSFPDKSGKQAKIVVEDDSAYLYIGLQSMQFNSQSGHLLEMFIMDNLKVDSDDIIESYTEVYPEVLEYTDETDDYGPPSKSKYPKLLKFDVTKWITVKNAYIPVQVNVPVMGSSAEQPAYIRCYWNTLALVEGAEPDDDGNDTEPEEPVILDTAALEEALDAASQVNKKDYTEKSYAALTAGIAAGDALPYVSGAVQEMVDLRTTAVYAATAALLPISKGGAEDNPGGSTDSDEDDTEDSIQAAKQELQLLYMEALNYKTGNYTETTLAVLNTAIQAALTVLKNNSATELQVSRASQNLQKAIDSLAVKGDTDTSSVKKTSLNALISVAASLNSSDYTSNSWLQLTTALTMARVTSGDGSATQSEVDAQVGSLQSAISSLVAAGSSGSSSDSSNTGSDEDDGYYKVSVRLWHSSLNKASMGDSAVVNKAYVHVEDGNITMRLVTKKMTVSGITAHLHSFSIYDDGDYEDAELVSTESSKWVYEFELPNDTSTYYKCKVDPQVDVMGDDAVKARLKVTWSTLKEVDEDDWDDLEGDTDDDDDDSSSSSGSTYTTELSSGETGIKIQGNTGGPGMVLEASKQESGEFYDRASSALTEKVNKFVLYDINLRSGSSYVQPTSSVTIRIPVPTGYDSSKLVLYRVNDDGSLQEINGKVNGSYFEASVDHFSLYALAESSQVVAEASAQVSKTSAGSSLGSSTVKKTFAAGTTKTKTSLSAASVIKEGVSPAAEVPSQVAGREIPYTGDTMPVKELMGTGLLAALACLATLISDRRRKKEK